MTIPELRSYCGGLWTCAEECPDNCPYGYQTYVPASAIRKLFESRRPVQAWGKEELLDQRIGYWRSILSDPKRELEDRQIAAEKLVPLLAEKERRERPQTQTYQSSLTPQDVALQYFPHGKQKGREWWATCPIHGEKTASFSINLDTGLWSCFGCSNGGSLKRLREIVDGRG